MAVGVSLALVASTLFSSVLSVLLVISVLASLSFSISAWLDSIDCLLSVDCLWCGVKKSEQDEH